MHRPIITFIVLIACGGKNTLQSGDPRLTQSQGRQFFEQKLFTGIIVESLPDITRSTQYVGGLEEGQQVAEFTAGGIAEQRTYKAGKKNGIHRGWFPDGKDRFYTEFSEDHYSGEHWTWHPNGNVAEFKKYTPDGEILVHKHWRESGQIYRNQVFAVAQKKEAGMPGVKLCNKVKDTVGSRQ